MELRPARADELDLVGEITLAAYDEFMDGPEEGYRDELADAAGRYHEAELWVAVDGGDVLGTVAYCPPGSPWRELARHDEGEFRMLAVHPRARGRGVGQALADLCERRAREHGATAMVLSSLPSMASAHRIYGRLGYTRDPDRDWDPVPGVHLVAFVKELT
jgi:ribosomal protein S18 acetylase RimI-like enzyme